MVLEQEDKRPKGLRSAEERARERVKAVCYRNLFGLDISPDLVRTCQMNLVPHGDSSSNIYRADSVLSPGEWDSEVRRVIPYGQVGVLLTNPPFGNEGQDR